MADLSPGAPLSCRVYLQP